MIAWPEKPVLRLPANTRGVDYVIGDVHGTMDIVIEAMRAVNFRPSVDRLLCLGDLIDRGNGSHRVAKMLAQPYVFAVSGNHEAILSEVYADGEPHQGVLDFLHSRNGFEWWEAVSPEDRKIIVEAIRKMPFVIEVETPRGIMGLVHADVPKGMAWPDFISAIEAKDDAVGEIALWGRDRLHANDDSGVPGVIRVYVGHTPVRGVLKLANVVAIDTGAVFGMLDPMHGGYLTMADLNTGTVELSQTAPMVRPSVVVYPPSIGRPRP